jgi:hypothetical protein
MSAKAGIGVAEISIGATKNKNQRFIEKSNLQVIKYY